MIDLGINDMIVTCGRNRYTLATPAMKEFIMDAARSSAWDNQTPSHVIHTDRDGTTPGDTCIDVRYTRENYPYMIGSTNVSPACGISGSLQVGNKR